MSLSALASAFAEALGQAPDLAHDPVPSAEAPAPLGSRTSALEAAPGAAPAGDDSRAGRDPADDHFAVTPCSILEGLLFVGDPGGGALPTERLASAMRGVGIEEIHELVRELNRQYAASGSALVILSEGAGYRMTLRAELAPLRRRFLGRVREARLSQAAIDVLSLVAYRQPLTAEEVSQLRGVPSGPLLAQLVRRDLLRQERSDDEPRAPRYHTTARFLDVLGIASLEELPTSRQVDER